MGQKMRDIRPEYINLSSFLDKAAIKKYVASIIYKKSIIPILEIVLMRLIGFYCLQQFVLKYIGGFCGIVVCKDKIRLDIEVAKAKLLKGKE